MSTNERTQPCSDRIEAELKARQAQFEIYLSPPDSTDEGAIEWLDDYLAQIGERLDADDRAVVDYLRDENADWRAEITNEDSGWEGYEYEDAFKEIFDRYIQELDDNRGERIDESILAVSTTVEMRIELSTGGPADYLTCEVDPDTRQIDSSVVYHFADWWDHASTHVPDGSPLYRVAEYFVEIAEMPGGEARGY